MLYNYLISMFFFYRWSVSNLQRHIQICGGFVATEAPNLGKILVQNLNLQQDFTKISQPAAGFCKNFPANISDKAKTRYSRMPCATVAIPFRFTTIGRAHGFKALTISKKNLAILQRNIANNLFLILVLLKVAPYPTCFGALFRCRDG